ncbi:MAG: hypothetical protein K1565_09975 [Candidatus Thiodiazotropha sp. (ex. Lucinisca nassula)]|nr:hypothetical protein [Candidatus Thiodiazotropha sp. (ex. Lucinisca nassula)]
MRTSEVITQLAGMGVILEIVDDSIWIFPRAELTDKTRQLVRHHKLNLIHALKTGEDTQILANAFYSHLLGEAKQTGCCDDIAGRYCDKGQRLKNAYHLAVRQGDCPIH